MSINLSNVNISLAEFQATAVALDGTSTTTPMVVEQPL